MVAVDMMYLSSNKLASQDTFGPNGATDTIMAAVTEGDFCIGLERLHEFGHLVAYAHSDH